jgi:hypothetical protein
VYCHPTGVRRKEAVELQVLVEDAEVEQRLE